MKKILAASVIYYLTLLPSCKQAGLGFVKVKDKDMAIEVSKLSKPGDSGLLIYKVRLIPDKQLLAEKNTTEKQALWYRMDSCFYLNVKNRKVYAAMVEPVANGVSGTYEYLLEFETTPLEENDARFMVYNDRYLNRKIYNLKLN